MRKFYSEACEVIYRDAMANFEIGAISEARLKEYEEECFIDKDNANSSASEPQEEKPLVKQHVSA